MPYQRLLHVWCVLLILVAPLCASAQWNRVPLPPSGYVRGLARAGQSLVARTSSLGGVWKFDRTSQQWSEDNAGIADMNIQVITGSDRYVVACGYGGTFIRGVNEQSYRSYPGAPKSPPADVVLTDDTITAVFGPSVYSIVIGPKLSSWELVSTLPGSESYALARMDDGTWYASTDKGLYRSLSTTTMTWNAVTLPSEVGTYRVTDIGSYKSRLYINANGRLYVSVDHGAIWQHLPVSASRTTVTNIDVAPDGSIVTWYSFDNAWISRNNGQSFENVTTPSEVPYTFENRCFDAEGALWSTSVRGAWRHTSATQGQFVVDGLYASPVTIIGQSATDMLTFCETIGLLKVRTADQQHTLFSEDEALLRATSVTIASNGVGAITSLFPIHVTADSGKTFHRTTNAPNQMMAARLTSSGTLVGACSDGRVYEYSGSAWIRRTDSCPELLNGITADEHGTIYGVSHNRLYRWSVTEKTWAVLQYTIAPHWFTGIEQAPDGRVYLCTTSGLHIYDTTTQTGAPIGYPMTNVTMSAIAFIDATHIVAAGWGRLFYTSNSGQSWKNATDDLPVRYVNSIAVTKDGRITIGTNGGMYTRTIKDLATSVDDEPAATDDNVFPNPVSQSAMVHITVSTSTIDAVRIVDMNGQMVRDVTPTITPSHHILVSTDGLSAGTYVVIIHSGTSVEHRRIVVY